MKPGLSAAIAACLLVACGSDTPPSSPDVDAGAHDAALLADGAPPLACRTPAAAPATLAFTEVTDELGLGAAASPRPLGSAFVAGDLDGDRYPDLIVIYPTTSRTQPGETPTAFVLMNRPHPDDSSGKRRIFVDATEASGVLATRDGAGRRGFGSATLGDLDNDGSLDLVVCAGFPDATTVDPCDALLNDGKGHFTLAPSSELDAKVFWVPNGVLLDIDRDGKLDFWPATVGFWPNIQGEAMKLFRGNGDGTFTDIAGQLGLSKYTPPMFGATACDIDDDGDDDLLVASYGRTFNMVFRNDGNKLTEIGAQLGVASDDREDFSDDHSYRCYCAANAGACPSTVPAPDALLGCPGRGWIAGVSDKPAALGGNTFSIACGDIDNDGDMDLMTAEIRHGDVGSASDPSELLINQLAQTGKLDKLVRPGNQAMGLHRPYSGMLWNEGDMIPVFADFDLDGRKDIFMASSDYPDQHAWLWQQQPDGKFAEVSAKAGVAQPVAQGVVAVDYDLDGDLDLIVGTSLWRVSEPKLNEVHAYRNDVGQQRNFINIRLVGGGAGKANRSAFGARVRVTAGGVTQTQQMQGGYDTQNAMGLTFGLDAACIVDKVEVRWPDKQNSISVYERLPANYHVELRQGDAAPHYLDAP
ncbi:MAG: VCBS repeat-containing protein [Myxococcales bacterium]|nr:VCBS repeat-containing protein [Myxococcales bacterium]